MPFVHLNAYCTVTCLFFINFFLINVSIFAQNALHWHRKQCAELGVILYLLNSQVVRLVVPSHSIGSSPCSIKNVPLFILVKSLSFIVCSIIWTPQKQWRWNAIVKSCAIWGYPKLSLDLWKLKLKFIKFVIFFFR